MITQLGPPYFLRLDEGVSTRSYKQKFNQEDNTCATCGKPVETIEDFLLECGSNYPDVEVATVTLLEALEQRDNEGNVNISTIDMR